MKRAAAWIFGLTMVIVSHSFAADLSKAYDGADAVLVGTIQHVTVEGRLPEQQAVLAAGAGTICRFGVQVNRVFKLREAAKVNGLVPVIWLLRDPGCDADLGSVHISNGDIFIWFLRFRGSVAEVIREWVPFRLQAIPRPMSAKSGKDMLVAALLTPGVGGRQEEYLQSLMLWGGAASDFAGMRTFLSLLARVYGTADTQVKDAICLYFADLGMCVNCARRVARQSSSRGKALPLPAILNEGAYVRDVAGSKYHLDQSERSLIGGNLSSSIKEDLYYYVCHSDREVAAKARRLLKEWFREEGGDVCVGCM